MATDLKETYILAIDQGTTSSRAIIFNGLGQKIALAQRELEVFTPKSGWVEQDAAQIWQDVVDVCLDVVRDANVDISCVGITNQRETTILWDRHTGQPIYNAIVWQDRRTAQMCKELKDKGYEAQVTDITGLLLDPYFSGTKIRWILDQNPEWQIRAEQGDILFGTVESFLIWHLSDRSVHKTDVTNASRTLLMDVETQEWSDDMCHMLNIPKAMLPQIVNNTDHFTDIKTECLSPLGGIAVHGVAGDQQSALVGQACFETGMIKSTYGTGCFALVNTGGECIKSKHRLLTTVAWKTKDETIYALEGSIFVAGAAVQFLRDNLKFFEDAKETFELARSIEDTDGVYFIPALTGLGAPHWDANVKGAIFGMHRGTTIAHIVRAALDAQAYQTRDLLGAMAEDMKEDICEMRVDGGLVKNDYVTQVLADQTRLKIKRPANIEATAWGAASLAGLGFGIFANMQELSNIWVEEHSFKPHQDEVGANQEYAQWLDYLSRLRIDV